MLCVVWFSFSFSPGITLNLPAKLFTSHTPPTPTLRHQHRHRHFSSVRVSSQISTTSRPLMTVHTLTQPTRYLIYPVSLGYLHLRLYDWFPLLVYHRAVSLLLVLCRPAVLVVRSSLSAYSPYPSIHCRLRLLYHSVAVHLHLLDSAQGDRPVFYRCRRPS